MREVAVHYFDVTRPGFGGRLDRSTGGRAGGPFRRSL